MIEFYHVLYWIGIILFGGYFVYSGLNHFKRHQPMSGYANAMGVPYSMVAVFVSGVLLLLGGLGVIFHFHAVIALWLLVIFLVPVTFKMHAFWNMPDPAMKAANKINFLKNLGLLGAVLILMSYLY